MTWKTWLPMVSLLLLVASSVSANGRQGTEQQRAASVLLEEFESVFYLRGSLLVDGVGSALLTKRHANALRAPFAYLLGGLHALGGHLSNDLLGSTDAAVVGAKDFRPPSGKTGLGDVQSRFCYVLVLRNGSKFDLKREATASGLRSPQDSVWEWSAPPTEGHPDRYSFFAAQVARSYVLMSSSLEDLRAVSAKLSSSSSSPILKDVREWAKFSQHEIWGYRTYQHASETDVASGSNLVPGARALEFFVDMKQKQGVLRLFSSASDAASKLNDTHTLPPLKQAGAGTWETSVDLSAETGPTMEQILTVMGLFGFGVYV